MRVSLQSQELPKNTQGNQRERILARALRRRLIMAILCKPAIAVPEYVITMEQTLELCQQIHAGHPQLDLALRLLRNTGIRKRHIVRPVDEVLQHRGFEERNSAYEEQSKRRTPPVIFQALKNAGVTAKDIDVII